MMTVRVNGRDQDLTDGATVLSLLETAGLQPGRVAVELNGRVVPRTGFHRVHLSEGDVLEVVHFVGGG
jgi:thiamine biosynthesis protein ThiS